MQASFYKNNLYNRSLLFIYINTFALIYILNFRYFAVFASPGAQPRLGHSMRAGTKLYYSCQKDFVLEGNSDRTCIGGVWTGEEPKCRSSGCGQPQNIVNGEFRFLGSNDASQEGKVVEGSEVFYFCKSGYRPVDSGQTNAKMTCHDGKWEGAVPECGMNIFKFSIA